MGEISVVAALLAGVLSFASPCVLPMLPTFALIMAQNDDRIWQNTVAFLSGFSLIFILLGTTASALGHLLWSYQDVLRQLGAIIVIFMGLALVGLLPVRFLAQEYRPFLKGSTHTRGGAFFLGVAFSLGWTPCTGPILAAILVYASQTETLVTGMLLLLAYSLGFAVPFFLLTVIWRKWLTKLLLVYRFLPYMQRISGILLILLGILLWRNDLIRLVSWW